MILATRSSAKTFSFVGKQAGASIPTYSTENGERSSGKKNGSASEISSSGEITGTIEASPARRKALPGNLGSHPARQARFYGELRAKNGLHHVNGFRTLRIRFPEHRFMRVRAARKKHSAHRYVMSISRTRFCWRMIST
jgi:hypothetical protein